MPSYGYRAQDGTPRFVRLLQSRKLGILVTVVAVALLLVTFSNKGLLRRILLERDVAAKRERIESLRNDITRLSVVRDRLHDDPATIEHVAREVHGMIKPGEIVYRVRPMKPAEPPR